MELVSANNEFDPLIVKGKILDRLAIMAAVNIATGSRAMWADRLRLRGE